MARTNLELLQTQSKERDLRAAKARLEQATARLQQAEARLAFTILRSPFAGVITDQFLYPGDMAKPESPLFVVMDLSAIIARAQIPASDAAQAKPGQKAKFTGKDTGSGAFWGVVKVVNAAIDPARRTVEVWAEFTERRQELRPGAFGTLEIMVGPPAKRVVVPLRAVMLEEGSNRGTVMIVDARNIAHARKVETGMTREDCIEIAKGIRAGEQVVIQGAYGMPDNTEVKRK